jgi:hypothetical protein
MKDVAHCRRLKKERQRHTLYSYSSKSISILCHSNGAAQPEDVVVADRRPSHQVWHVPDPPNWSTRPTGQVSKPPTPLKHHGKNDKSHKHVERQQSRGKEERAGLTTGSQGLSWPDECALLTPSTPKIPRLPTPELECIHHGISFCSCSLQERDKMDFQRMSMPHGRRWCRDRACDWLKRRNG